MHISEYRLDGTGRIKKRVEQRSGVERRIFTYSLCIPERRSGCIPERRSGLDQRTSERDRVAAEAGYGSDG